MRMTIRQTCALPLFALLFSCAKENVTGIGYQSDPDAVVVEAGVGSLTRSNPLGTEDEQKAFNSGDVIALSNGGEYFNYTFDGGVWTPETGKYLRWETSSMTFNAYYPASADNSFDLGRLKTDQSDLKDLIASDYMRVSQKVDKTSDNKLTLTMKRMTSRIIVHVKGFQDEFKGLNPKVSGLSVRISTVINKYGYGGPLDTEVNAYMAANGDFYLLSPQSRANLLEMSLTVDCGDGQTKTLKAYSSPLLEPGKSYTFNLLVGKNTVKVAGINVNDWQTGAPIVDHDTEVEEYDSWDGAAIANDYDGGTGTAEDPYKIRTAAQLALLASKVNGGERYLYKYFDLTGNIDLAGHPWTPIGNKDNNFGGEFNGKGFSIINLTVSDHEYSGLFGRAYYQCTIRNLNLRNCDIRPKASSSSGTSIAGLLVAGIYGGVIDNCKVEGMITLSEEGIVGGVLGISSVYDLTISNCESDIVVETPLDKDNSVIAGGIAGSFTMGRISNVLARGKFVGCTMAGGIAGNLADDSNYTCELSDCVSYVDIYANKVSSFNKIGGLVGYWYNGGKISDCSAYGKISYDNESQWGYLGGAFGIGYRVVADHVHFGGVIELGEKSNGTLGAFVGRASNITTSGCTYSKSGAGNLNPWGKMEPEGSESQQDIKAI